MPAVANARSRSFCITINNPDDHPDTVARWREAAASAAYAIEGAEVGASGTPHFQCYIHFSNARSSRSIISAIPGAHVEIARGSAQDNIDYCSKDGNIIEYGTRPARSVNVGQMNQARWTEVKEAAKRGDMEAIPADIYIRYYGALKAIAKDHMQPVADLDAPCGIWLTGESGVGKSYGVRQKFGATAVYNKPVNDWWDGYQGQEVVLIEDIDPFNVSIGGSLKRWGDSYAFIASVKGSAMRIRPKWIIVTSQYRIGGVWQDIATTAALNRRYKTVNVVREEPINWDEVLG